MLLLIACEDRTPTATEANATEAEAWWSRSISVTPESLALEPQDTARARATVRNRYGRVIPWADVDWVSRDSRIATVSRSGLVRAIAPGVTVVVASSDGRRDSTAIRVHGGEQDPGAGDVVATLVITPSAASVPVGGQRTFGAVARDSAGVVMASRPITWSSASPGVATVDDSGVARGVAAGSTQIRARAGDVTAQAQLSVTAAVPAPVATIEVTPSSATIGVGQTRTYQATLRDSSGAVLLGRPVTWSSSAPGVASVQSSGTATGVSAGTAQVRATSEGRTGSATLTVQGASPPPTGGNSMYYNSSEAGCASGTADILFCDDFEDGDWYTIDADRARSSGGFLQTDGWEGTIYANPITPAGAAVCGARGVRGTNCAATSGQLSGGAGGRNMGMHTFAGGPVTELWARWYYRADPGFQWGAEKNMNFTKNAGDISWFNIQFNCGAGGRKSSATPFVQIIHGSDICQPPNVSNITLVPDRWYFFEVHLKLNSSGTVADGLIEIWINDCGATGNCSGTPTLRTRMTNVRFNRNQSGCTTNPCKIEVLWLENWSNPGSAGTSYYDQLKVAKSGPIGFMQ